MILKGSVSMNCGKGHSAKNHGPVKYICKMHLANGIKTKLKCFLAWV